MPYITIIKEAELANKKAQELAIKIIESGSSTKFENLSTETH